MKASLALAMICIGLGGCAGCQKEGALRVNSPGNLSGHVLLSVSNESMHSEAKRPRISDARLWVDGVETSTQPHISSGNGKMGWHETAHFPVPSDATTVQIRATVVSYGKTYAITQDWVRETASSLQGTWKCVQPASIQLRQEQGKSKS